MLNRNFKKSSVALTLITLIGALSSTANASPCPSRTGKVTKELLESKAFNKIATTALDEASKKNPDNMVFLVVDSKNRTPITITVPLPSEGNHVDLPAKLLALNEGDEVYAYHRSSSAYIFEGDQETLRSSALDAKSACLGARVDNRFIRPSPSGENGCEIVTLSGTKSATLIYGKMAQRCDDIAILSQQRNLSKDQGEQFKEDEAYLMQKLGPKSRLGVNRSPGIETQSTRTAAKDDIQPIGSSNAPLKKKTAGNGN
ncbi:MAG: hypothetical protein H7301_14570 [Cryobacterium sp.]|nr:hypothetical protein [Oligoflexia bacterium]